MTSSVLVILFPQFECFGMRANSYLWKRTVTFGMSADRRTNKQLHRINHLAEVIKAEQEWFYIKLFADLLLRRGDTTAQ